MTREIPFDPTRDEDWDPDEGDYMLDPEGRSGFSWERLSSDGNKNEGWGHEGSGQRRRRRKYEGDYD